MDLALNNLQRLICHKTQQTKPSIKKIKIGNPHVVAVQQHGESTSAMLSSSFLNLYPWERFEPLILQLWKFTKLSA